MIDSWHANQYCLSSHSNQLHIHWFRSCHFISISSLPAEEVSNSQYLVEIMLFILYSLPYLEKYKIFIKWKKFWLTVKHHSGSPLWKQIQNHPRQAPLSSLLHLYISILSQTDQILRNIHLRHFSVFSVWEENINLIDEPELNCLKITIRSAELHWGADCQYSMIL